MGKTSAIGGSVAFRKIEWGGDLLHLNTIFTTSRDSSCVK
jgi:hypothetical protein